MADEPTPPPAHPAPAPEKSLRELLEDRFKELRATDQTIRNCQRTIAKQADVMRAAYQKRKLANRTIRAQEEWLREEAAIDIRKRLGIAAIPGFVSKRDSARAFRAQLIDRIKAAKADGRSKLTG